MNGATMLAIISGILIYMAGILTWLLVKVSTKKPIIFIDNYAGYKDIEKLFSQESKKNLEKEETK